MFRVLLDFFKELKMFKQSGFNYDRYKQMKGILMDKYRVCILFPSGSELSETVNFKGLINWVKQEINGYKILSINGYPTNIARNRAM
jgi:hypothetical protein